MKRLATCCLIWGVASSALPLNGHVNQDNIIQRHYSVSFLGVPLVDVDQQIRLGEHQITVSYDNRPKPVWDALFVKIHNVYATTYERQTFRPLRWGKTIQEWSFQQQSHGQAQDSTLFWFNGRQFKVPPHTFTIFSAVHFLEAKAFQPDLPTNIKVFIEGQIWQVSVQHRLETEHQQKLQHLILRLGRATGRRLLQKTDILTSHIAKPGSQVDLWVAEAGFIVKGRFGTPPEVVDLTLDSVDSSTGGGQ